MKNKNMVIDLWINNNFILVDNVPGSVCPQCGEKVLSPETTKKVYKLIKEKLKKKEVTEVKIPKIEYVSAI